MQLEKGDAAVERTKPGLVQLRSGVICDRDEVTQLLNLLSHTRKRLHLAIKQGSGLELEKRSLLEEVEAHSVALAQAIKEIRTFAPVSVEAEAEAEAAAPIAGNVRPGA